MKGKEKKGQGDLTFSEGGFQNFEWRTYQSQRPYGYRKKNEKKKRSRNRKKKETGENMLIKAGGMWGKFRGGTGKNKGGGALMNLVGKKIWLMEKGFGETGVKKGIWSC